MNGRLRRKQTMSFRRHTRDSEIGALSFYWPSGRCLPPQRPRRDPSPRRRSSYPLAGGSPAEPTSVLLDNSKLSLDLKRVKPRHDQIGPFSQIRGRLFHLRQRMQVLEKARRLYSLRQQVGILVRSNRLWPATSRFPEGRGLLKFAVPDRSCSCVEAAPVSFPTRRESVASKSCIFRR